MRLFKPNFWKKRNILSILLTPLSLIVHLCIFLKKKFTKIVSYKIPVICVGNIYMAEQAKLPCLYIADS